jgi:hypothetical protein
LVNEPCIAQFKQSSAHLVCYLELSELKDQISSQQGQVVGALSITFLWGATSFIAVIDQLLFSSVLRSEHNPPTIAIFGVFETRRCFPPILDLEERMKLFR